MSTVTSFDATIRWPVIRSGHRMPPTKTLQYLLRAQGHTIAADGIFGAQTDAAVRAFQAARGLVVDGIVGPRTWGAVIVTVRRGSQGDAVRGVQVEIDNRAGSDEVPSAVDGIFGPATERFVRGFQEALHVEFPEVAVDGVVGPVTWRALVSGYLLG